MAAIALVTAAKIEVVESIQQCTLPAGVTVIAGQAVQANSAGKWALAKATTAALARAVFIATTGGIAGTSITGVRLGYLDGYALSGLAYNDPIYLSDTDGTLADAAGTVPIVLGVVAPAWAQPLGTAADKILLVAPPLASTLAA